MTTSDSNRRRQNRAENLFDIQVRNYIYQGVPEPSYVQIQKSVVGLVKRAKDKASRQKVCSLFN